ncbi:AfsR/SARP family transcriptional regulator [Nocardia cyriacigeorgica]|uniref:AfsR/SARP family transcriptional regulator n=1 Tax=Nocardia cyriacigeorgica TaxID=135487 RepID=A0A6P1D6I7_9NOCA|nr:BTAD domain-containing putative transcriptional regulator [Nocardia cyriacigeorgica]NEW45678.1 AfsR/SARP family transcriptional regulator [Nocardia cyriacigeorgica]NEW55393.1 AfsR/SARP family transcriptional regulator [Nocardia cyriacigeorgica]
MRFGVLGPLEVWTKDEQSVRVPEAKVRALLAALLVNRGRPVSADRLVDDLWGERLPANPAGALQLKVSRLRQALGGAESVAFGPSGYRLRVETDQVDADLFEAGVTRARGLEDAEARARNLSDVLGLWRGSAFSGFEDEEFASPEIRRLEELRLVALEELAEARLELGEYELTAGELAEVVAAHPLRERLRAAHVRALYGSGRQNEALASYGDLRARLRDELGLDPGPELRAVHTAVLRQDPALRARPDPAMRGNLPARLTELIGRKGAVTQIGGLLGTGRMVTLTGPGGVGKTRLAIEAAGSRSERFPDGVWLVELAGLASGCGQDDVVDAVAAVMGVRQDASRRSSAVPESGIGRLAAALGGRRMLLVLDNCEHVVQAAADVAAGLLRAVPGLHVLATSQERLATAGELLWTVPPLDGDAAVQLFAERAAAADPGFAVSEGNRSAVESICRRLDGIPLALELAATRVRSVGVAELAERLDDRFRLLSSGRRDAPARQRTLRAMIEWSWEPLTDAERVVLRRLAIHADGCTLRAAEGLCAGDGVDSADVLDLLGRLVDRSLVVHRSGRYRLLESVSAYCVEQMSRAGELEWMRDRHLAHYLHLAEHADLRGHDQRAWLERLDAESGNVRAALRHAGGSRSGLRLVNILTWYWFLRGRLGEARRSLTLALTSEHTDSCGPDADPVAIETMAWRTGIALLLGEDADPVGRSRSVVERLDAHGVRAARAKWFMAFAQFGHGDQDILEQRLHDVLAESRAENDRWGMAAALVTLASPALLRSDIATARRAGARSLALFEEMGDRWGQLRSTGVLGDLAEITGDYAEAARLRRDGLRNAEELGLWPEVSFRMATLGRLALLTGDLDEANDLHERARRIAAERSSRHEEQFAEMGLALVARRQGRLDDAERYLRRWLDWNRRREGEPGVALILAELGFVAELRGDTEAALALHLEGEAAARKMGDPRSIALALEGLAGAHALAGRHERAAILLGTATSLRESVGAPLPPGERGDVDRITAAARSALGARRFAAAFDAGRNGSSCP